MWLRLWLRLCSRKTAPQVKRGTSCNVSPLAIALTACGFSRHQAWCSSLRSIRRTTSPLFYVHSQTTTSVLTYHPAPSTHTNATATVFYPCQQPSWQQSPTMPSTQAHLQAGDYRFWAVVHPPPHSAVPVSCAATRPAPRAMHPPNAPLLWPTRTILDRRAFPVASAMRSLLRAADAAARHGL